MHHLLRRKYLISFFYIAVCLVGWASWTAIPIENAPELNLPSLTVSYSWGSTSPEIVEQEITRKVESVASNLRGVREISSNTQQGRSSVTITFSKQTPVDHRILELREFLYSIEENLPVAVSTATINRQIPKELQDQQTFIIYTLSGDRKPDDLLRYAQRNIKNPLFGLVGLANIKLEGIEAPALIIEFDRDNLERYQLSPSEILGTLREQLGWRSSGFVDQLQNRYTLSVPPQFTSVAELESYTIPLPNALKTLRLGDVADVRVSEFPAKTKRRINGAPSLTIEFEKESGADALALSNAILERMKKQQANLPEDLTLRLQYDSTENLTRQFDQLKTQAMLSVLFVFLLVLAFIRKIRAPLVIIGSVLFSIFLSVSILLFIEYTLNVITLAGLTVALGMIIDNAVVVFEQVNPGLPSNREDRIKHIRTTLPLALVPVLGSTFTTIGIFMPLLFALEELRLFLIPLAAALTLTLISSVVISFTWIPYALIWLTPGDKTAKKSTYSLLPLNQLLWVFKWRYRLRWVLTGSLALSLGIPLFLIEEPDWENSSWPEFTKTYFENRERIDPFIGGIPYRFAKETYFGSPWQGTYEEIVTVNIRPPQGTPLSEIDKIAASYERIAKPYAHAFTYYEAQLSEHFGAYLKFVVDPEYLTQNDPYMFYGEAIYLAARTGNVATSVYGFGDGISTGFGGSSSQHTITLTGYSYQELLEMATSIKTRLEQNRRVREVDIASQRYFSRSDYQEYKLALDENRISALNLDRRQVLAALALDINPENAFGNIEFEGEEMALIGREKQRTAYEEGLMQRVRSTETSSFSLATIGEIRKEKALSQIRRKNQSYERVISFKYLGNYRMGNTFTTSIIENTPVPVGVSISGNRFLFNSTEENTRNLMLIALLSILSVWMIVAALMESWKYSILVISAVPFALIGVMAGTLANDLAFDRGAIAGSLLCIGVVVNNAILLLHKRLRLRASGINGIRSWIYVLKEKLRPILITTLTTIFGLLPMILFQGDAFWENLAIVVCWGLGFSTVLLIVMAGVFARMRVD
ncbi:MAG: efflux RND transporter permease subunit [Bacteroidota bacterium]